MLARYTGACRYCLLRPSGIYLVFPLNPRWAARPDTLGVKFPPSLSPQLQQPDAIRQGSRNASHHERQKDSRLTILHASGRGTPSRPERGRRRAHPRHPEANSNAVGDGKPFDRERERAGESSSHHILQEIRSLFIELFPCDGTDDPEKAACRHARKLCEPSSRETTGTTLIGSRILSPLCFYLSRLPQREKKKKSAQSGAT